MMSPPSGPPWRSKSMQEICHRAACEYASHYVGQTVSVLLETPYPDGYIDGHTDTYLNVMVKTDKPEGSLVSVRITDCQNDQLFGIEAN